MRALLLPAVLVVALLLPACGPGAPERESAPRVGVEGAPTAGSAPDPSELLEADRAFARAVAEGGTAAWVSWFAEDGAQIQASVGEVRGRDAIRELMGVLDDPTVSLTWEPERADVAASGDLGWTTGSYVSETTLAGGAVRRGQGRYVTIWRRQPDGRWRVVMDLGNPTDGG